MKILIDRIYSGPGLLNLPAGVYDIDDPALNGRGKYLLASKIARDAAGVKGVKAKSFVESGDDDPYADDEPVVLRYTGTNKREHTVEADGEEYVVPKLVKDGRGDPVARVIRVPASAAEDLLSRGTFKLAED